MNHIRLYFDELKGTMDELPVESIEALIRALSQARAERRKVFIMGNGGSAATATHFVCDLAKNTRKPETPDFRVIGLADNMASFSALANDDGYENVFVGQLASLVDPGDLVIGISTSGNSPNVLNAIQLADQAGAHTIGFTGFDGGQLGSMVDLHVHVPSDCIEHVEDAHLIIEHVVCKVLRESDSEERVLEGDASEIPHTNQHTNLHTLEALTLLREELPDWRELGEFVRRTLTVIVDTLHAESGSMIVLDKDGRVIKGSVLFDGRERPIDAQSWGEVFGNGLAGWVVRNREAALVASTRDDPRWLNRVWDEEDGAARSAVSVPLGSGSRPTGVLTLVRSNSRQFSEVDVAFLFAIAAYVSIGADEALEISAKPDKLGHMYNVRSEAGR